MTRARNTEVLSTDAYKTSDCLESRRSLYDYLIPAIDLSGEISKRLKLRHTDSVLDIGCGSGPFARECAKQSEYHSYAGIDLSHQMIAELNATLGERRNMTFVPANVQSIPFGDKEFSKVLAQHMLYHVPDLDAAFAEIRRVMTDDATFVATTNSTQTKAKLFEFIDNLTDTIRMPSRPRVDERFCLENAGQILGRCFSQVEVTPIKSTLRVPASMPIVNWVDSTRSFWDPQPTDTQWNALIRDLSFRIEDEIDMHGAFVDSHVIALTTVRQ